jgi:hypothetical protein
VSDIYHDIETVPGQSAEVTGAIRLDIEKEIENLAPPGNYKKQETIDAWMEAEAARLRSEEEFEARHRRCSFSSTKGEIISIACAINQDASWVITRAQGEDEYEMLGTFWAQLLMALPNDRSDHVWIGHNCLSIDLRFLWHRSVILGIKPPINVPANVSPSDRQVYDTMVRWAGWGQRISQDELARALGFDGKPSMDGSDVYDYWLAGRIAEIGEYNRYDAETVRKIHRRMTFK